MIVEDFELGRYCFIERVKVEYHIDYIDIWG